MTSNLTGTAARVAAAGAALFLLGYAALSVVGQNSAAEEARAIPAPTVTETVAPGATSETAIFAGGCFWGVQGVFQHVKGVTSAVSGYAGGEAATAHYRTVGLGSTGHAEAVQVTFDPRQVSYGKLLQIFFSVAHDPTQLDRQGPDSGTQYRSAIFPTSPEQARVAATYIAELDKAKVFPAPIVTRTDPARDGFFPAEAYHQDFLTLNPTYAYIVINDLPKVEALKRIFPESYREDPVLVAAKAHASE
jgi:peptide-methionine (S)-S-oxide reductase